MGQLMLGYAREDFTPDWPVRMNSQCTALEVWHNIFATALYFSDGEEQALVISLDLRELHDFFLEPIRPLIAEKTGVREENIVFVTTHNHSCPDVGASATVDNLVQWREKLGHPAMLRAAVAAVADAKPVTKMEGGTAVSQQISFVRRYRLEDGTWKGIATANASKAPRVAHESQADLQLRVVRLYRQGGKDVILMNYQTHAAGALSMFKDKLNADFCGEMRDTVEEATGALSVYLQGACGNTNYFTYLPHEKQFEMRDYRDVGVSLAKTALSALAHAEELPLGALQVRSQQFMGYVNHTLDHLAPIAREIGQMDDPEEALKAMRAAGINNRYERSGIVRRAEMPAQRNAELCSIAFGGFAMAFCPHEMFDELGMRLRAASPYEMTFPCNYAQCYRGYMPDHRMVPHGEYEVNMCQFLPGTGEAELLALLAQLQDMKKS